MTGYFCVTLFHVFLSILLNRRNSGNCGSVIFIVSPLHVEDIDRAALLQCGFDDVIAIENDDEKEGKNYAFQNLLFYSLYSRCHNYLKSLIHEKMILVYEGITTCQLRHWCGGEGGNRFDLDSDIDEFWLPDVSLLLDEEYLPRCREFSLAMDNMREGELRELCTAMNAVFRCHYRPIDGSTLMVDRYLANYGSFVLNAGIERILTQLVYYGSGEKPVIKRHPYDQNYRIKYQGLSGVRVIEDNVPWELIYLNNRLHNPGFHLHTYVIYNSFAPANIALLFGDHSYRCVCVEPVLDRYADIEGTYLNSRVTYEILNKFARKCGVEVKFVNGIEELAYETKGERYCTDDALWQLAENALKEQNIDNLLEIRAFRLQLDCALLSLKKRAGKYFFNADNSSAEISRILLRTALPQFTETLDVQDSDFVIDCNRTLVDYSRDSFDVRRFTIVEGCFRLAQQESDVEILLKNKENIYIWGATRSNTETFNILKKMKLDHKIRNVFDTYATGTSHGLPVVRFSPDLLSERSFIFICAAVAYREIAQILTGCGFLEGKDFALGVGINNV